MNKFTTDEAKSYFVKAGIVPLFDDYRRNSIKYKYRCWCGLEDSTNLGNLLRNFKKNPDYKQNCSAHSKKNNKPMDFDKFVGLFVNTGVEPLFDEYKGTRISYEYKCECGGISSVWPDYLIGEVKKNPDYKLRCKKCVSVDQRMDINIIRERVLDRGATLVSRDYDDNKTKKNMLINLSVPVGMMRRFFGNRLRLALIEMKISS